MVEKKYSFYEPHITWSEQAKWDTVNNAKVITVPFFLIHLYQWNENGTENS